MRSRCGRRRAMGEALFELEQIIRSKQESLTHKEVEFLFTYKSKALRDFTFGACLGAGVTWIVTQRLNNFLRINLSAGAAALSGFWRFSRSLDSSIDEILSLEGSWMQKELANLILNKHSNDPWLGKLISKHFYAEKVFDDSTSDKPKSRWRFRNLFVDNVAHYQQMQDSDSHSESSTNKTDLELKQVAVNPGIDLMANPLDCIFGYAGVGEVIHQPDTSSSSPRIMTYSHRKSRHRWRRMRHDQEGPSKS